MRLFGRKARQVKIVLKEGDKYFCHWGVDTSKDLISQGCRRLFEDPDEQV